MHTPWIYLGIAIATEVIGTTALKAAEGFTRPWPSLTVLISYSLSFYFFSLALRGIPLGIAYTIWAGVGLSLVAICGWIFYQQTLDTTALTGIAMVIAGVVVLGFSSSTVTH